MFKILKLFFFSVITVFALIVIAVLFIPLDSGEKSGKFIMYYSEKAIADDIFRYRLFSTRFYGKASSEDTGRRDDDFGAYRFVVHIEPKKKSYEDIDLTILSAELSNTDGEIFYEAKNIKLKRRESGSMKGVYIARITPDLTTDEAIVVVKLVVSSEKYGLKRKVNLALQRHKQTKKNTLWNFIIHIT